MMRLVLFYYSHGTNDDPFTPNKVASNHFAQFFVTEGLYSVFEMLIRNNVISSALVVIESGRGQGILKYGRTGIETYVVPRLEMIKPYLRDGDIIFVRGGFKAWYPMLEKLHEAGHWMWLYAANTGRQRWTFWDIVFNDLVKKSFVDPLGRMNFRYIKPINQDIFNYVHSTVKKYDLMIGASHIHDKKRQWLALDRLIRLKLSTGITPKCVMPGSPSRSTRSNRIKEKIALYDLNITMPGMLSRQELATCMNQSDIFYTATGSGQNDRGPLEAMACGCRIGIETPARHSPILYENTNCSTVHDDASLLNLLQSVPQNEQLELRNIRRQKNTTYFNSVSGLRVVYKDFVRFFSVFKKYPKRNREALYKEFVK